MSSLLGNFNILGPWSKIAPAGEDTCRYVTRFLKASAADLRWSNFMSSNPIIRSSTDADVATIVEIYAHYVRNTTATFEIDSPDAAEIAKRRADIRERRLPHLVAEVEGAVVGYAYAVPYRPRLAYRFTVEDSIYIEAAHTGRGLGRLLLAAVIEACELNGYRQMVAVIGGSDNAASIGLHASFGFVPAGLLRSVGFKFGRWLDSVLMQRGLGDGAGSFGLLHQK